MLTNVEGTICRGVEALRALPKLKEVNLAGSGNRKAPWPLPQIFAYPYMRLRS